MGICFRWWDTTHREISVSSLIPFDPNKQTIDSGLAPIDPPLATASGLVPFMFNFTAARRWTIGNLVDDFGFSSPLAFGGLVPDLWFDKIATIVGLFVDDSSNAVVLRASDDSQWAGRATIDLKTEGFADITLTYNGTFYVKVDIAYTDYIKTQLGNTIDVRIIPETVASWIDTDSWVDSELWFD